MDFTFTATNDAPKAIGPYSQAVTFGELIYTAGQIALDPAKMEIVGPFGLFESAEPALTDSQGDEHCVELERRIIQELAHRK